MPSLPELPPAPRAVRLTASGRSNLLAARWFLGLVLLVGAVAGALHVASFVSLSRQGIVAPVRVLDKRYTGGKSPRYVIEYALPGGVETRREDVDCRWFGAAQVGRDSPLTYLPGHPEVHEFGRVTGDEVGWAVRQAVFLLLVACVIPFVTFASVRGQIRRERGLLEQGSLVWATIERSEPAPRKGTSGRRMVYAYPTEGGVRHGELQTSGSGGERLAVGAALAVLYLPEESFESAVLDDLKMVELDSGRV